jgi:hypothetical protein
VDGIAKASEGMSEFGLDIVQSVMKGGVSRGDLAALLNKEDEN